MAKQKKKRTKKYSGDDASLSRPVITRVSAVNRSKLGQWWFEKKRFARPVLITAGVVIVVVILLIELIRIFSGHGA